jgi:predicted P-loop ATPase
MHINALDCSSQVIYVSVIDHCFSSSLRKKIVEDMIIRYSFERNVRYVESFQQCFLVCFVFQAFLPHLKIAETIYKP